MAPAIQVSACSVASSNGQRSPALRQFRRGTEWGGHRHVVPRDMQSPTGASRSGPRLTVREAPSRRPLTGSPSGAASWPPALGLETGGDYHRRHDPPRHRDRAEVPASGGPRRGHARGPRCRRQAHRAGLPRRLRPGGSLARPPHDHRGRHADLPRHDQATRRRVQLRRARAGHRRAAWTAALERVDPGRRPVRKTRHVAPHGDQTLEIDVFEQPADLVVVEVELRDEAEPVELPAWLGEWREVTGRLPLPQRQPRSPGRRDPAPGADRRRADPRQGSWGSVSGAASSSSSASRR